MKINKDDLKIGVTFTPCDRCDRVEVMRAKAVPISSDINYEDTLIRMDRQCGRCGALITQYDNYCPYCGAKLDGGKNE